MTTQVQVVNGNIEDAIRIFKKVVSKDGVHVQIKRRLGFVKPCEKKKEKQRLNAKRLREAERKAARNERFEGDRKWNWGNRRNNVYDAITKQNETNRLFVIRRSIATDPAGGNQDGKVS